MSQILWTNPTSDDAKFFAMPDPPKPAPVSEQKPEAIVERSGSESPDDRQSDSETDATPTVSTRDTPEPNTNNEAVPATDEQPAEQPVEQPLEQPSPEDSNNDHVEQHVTQPEEPSAPNPQFSESESSNNPPEEGADNDAVIAAIIANDLEEMDSAAPAAATPAAAQAQNEPAPENTTQQEHPAPSNMEPASESAAPPTEPAAPVSLLLVQEQPTTEITQTQSTNDDQPTSREPEVRLPVNHVYYFIQIFDIDNQVLRTVGSFFSGKDENVKSALRKHLAWPDNKELSIWQRVDGTSVTTASPSKTFSGFVPDGTCFIVGDRLNKNK